MMPGQGQKDLNYNGLLILVLYINLAVLLVFDIVILKKAELGIFWSTQATISQ